MNTKRCRSEVGSNDHESRGGQPGVMQERIIVMIIGESDDCSRGGYARARTRRARSGRNGRSALRIRIHIRGVDMH